MQYLKHSTTEVTMTALSEGLDAARSLDRLRHKNTQGYRLMEKVMTSKKKQFNQCQQVRNRRVTLV